MGPPPPFYPSERKFGFLIKPVQGCENDDYLEAISDIVGEGNIRTFGRVRNNYGVWVKSDEAAEKLQCFDTITVKNQNVAIWPYVKPILKVKLFNVPPFIPNDLIETELKKYGALKGHITVEPLFGISEKFKGIESFTRSTLMSFADEAKLPDHITVKTDEFSHLITTQVGRQKCFICHDFKHKSADCPQRKGPKSYATAAKIAHETPATPQTSDDKNPPKHISTPDPVNNKPPSPIHVATPPKRPRLSDTTKRNLVLRSDWKYNEWKNITQGKLNPEANKKIHKFLISLPKAPMESNDLPLYVPINEHESLAALLQELMSALPSTQIQLKRDLKLIADTIERTQ